MRILHLVHQYPPEWLGGTEVYTQSVAEELIRRGHMVGVVTRLFSGRRADEGHLGAEPSRVMVWRLSGGTTAPVGRFLQGLADPMASRRFSLVMRSFRPDVVHVQHLMGLPLGTVRFVTDFRIPCVVTLHDYWWLCPNAQLVRNDSQAVCPGPTARDCARCVTARLGMGWARRLAGAATPLLEWRARQLRELLARATTVVAPSQAMLDIYRQAGFDIGRAQVLPHGIELPQPRPQRSRPIGAPLKLLYLGGLSRQKGVHVVLEALRDIDPFRWEFAIAGDLQTHPEYTIPLRSAAMGLPVSFLGNLGRERVWQALSEADALVVPSLWHETFSLVVSEAFAAGKPVIASRMGALAERVRHEVDGLLVEPGDVEAWRAAIRGLIDDGGAVARLAAGVTRPLSLSAHVDVLERLYRD